MDNAKSLIPKFRGEPKVSYRAPLKDFNRRVLRRSKSVSDLKPLSNATSKYALLPLKPIPIKSIVGNGKSNSTTNLNAITSSKTCTSNNRVGAAGIKRNEPTIPENSLATKRRKAEAKNEKPKPEQTKDVPKPTRAPKPASYDYRARYNLLNEKHVTLVATHKEMKKHLTEVQSECETQINKLKSSEIEKTILESQAESLKSELEQLKEKYYSNLTHLQKMEELLATEKCKYEAEHNRTTALTIELNEIKEAYSTASKLVETTTVTLNETKCKLNCTLEYLEAYKSQLTESEQTRRELHEEIQNLKGNIRVLCRVRPPIPQESERSLCNINYVDDGTIELRNRENHKSEFIFDQVFPPQATQMELFEDMAGLVQSALDGYNVCVFAYGQTGSGKTYTMQGGQTDSTIGIIPRSMDLLFATINKLKKVGWEYTLEVSFLEIYNETIRDLLDNHPKHHEIRYNEGKGVTVTNLRIQPIASVKEFHKLMETAWKYRAVASTNFNEHSSRSHAVTKIYINGVNSESKLVYRGSLNLIDLAGSESAKTSSDERLQETKNINRSLSALGTVILALSNKDNHIPFRNSKLTYLLQSCLTGNSKTMMVVNISPLDECYGETMNSLRFAFKVKGVHINARRNKTYILPAD